jgi:hypothetical protein
LVEQLTLNQRVPGSSPGAPTKPFKNLTPPPGSHSDKRSAAVASRRLLLFGACEVLKGSVFNVRGQAAPQHCLQLSQNGALMERPICHDLRFTNDRFWREADVRLPLAALA